MFDLLAELKKIAQALDERGLKYSLCGGLAVGVYTEPRATIDIDLVVDHRQLQEITRAMEEIGFEKTSRAMDFERKQISIHRFSKIPRDGSEVLILDLCVPNRDAFPEVWQGWEKIVLEGAEIWVVSRKALIAMKKARGSQKDLADIELLEGKT